MINHIKKPVKTLVPLTDGMKWGAGIFGLPSWNVRFEEKLDGEFHVRQVGESVFVGELLRKEGGRFFAFDCLVLEGQSIREWPLRARLEALGRFSFPRPDTGRHGGELLARVLARGGEGIVAKDLDARYGEMWACKRLDTWLCTVTGMGGSQSVEISMDGNAAPLKAEIGQPCGRVSLPGGKVDLVRVGSVIKVEGMGLTDAGKIREPRLCKDTPDSWLVKY